jgi:predicted transposase YbfD/YdcC
MKILSLIEDIPDPRMEGKVVHNLGTIIFVSLCGILSGCESWSDICDYCEVKKDWLSSYVDLSKGVPSAWTFRRVFTLLDPDKVEYLLRTHAASIVKDKDKTSDQIAIDGKALRGSKQEDLRCLYSVSAWCDNNSLVLSEQIVSKKSNEIKAIPLLLENLSLKDTTVSIDAAGCQKSIAKLISNKKGDYVFGLKGNHPKLYQAVQDHIEKQGEDSAHKLHDSFDKSHGRDVRRRYFGYDISALPETSDWDEARTVIAVETIRSKDNDPTHKVSAHWRYYLSSHPADCNKMPDYIRNHWNIG